jgi:hypothetical protein
LQQKQREKKFTNEIQILLVYGTRQGGSLEEEENISLRLLAV